MADDAQAFPNLSNTKMADRVCEWDPQTEHRESLGWWSSGCGEEFVTDDDSPSPREWMKFCPYCGGRTEFPSMRGENS